MKFLKSFNVIWNICTGRQLYSAHQSQRQASTVALTSERYNVTRGTYSHLLDSDVGHFTSIVGRDNVLQSGLDSYNQDWIRICRGSSKLVLRPGSTAEMSQILSYCNKRKLAVCPQGGNTGLVGGSVPVFDEIIVSTTRMNTIISIDDQAGVLTCEAGCILESLDSKLSDRGLMMPLDLGAKGSCQIGGNLSTNAGGIRLLRYGTLHGNTLGIQAVLPNGTILDNLNPLIKDNTGYDIKNLFIGAEGTLGIITAASIKCPPKPTAINAALLSLESFDDCLKVLRTTKLKLGEILSAFELIDSDSRIVVERNLKLKYPLASAPFHILLETHGSTDEHDKEKLDSLLNHLIEKEYIHDGVMASDLSQVNHMWSLRERIAEALLMDGYCYKYDISLPLSAWYRIVEEFRTKLNNTECMTCCGYGHLGDGNLHLNMTSKEYSERLASLIEPFIYDWTAEQRGSISAEHGLGFKKKQFIYHSKSREMVDLMKEIKKLFDPHGIMNPYKYLPDD